MAKIKSKPNPLSVADIVKQTLNASDASCDALRRISITKEYFAHDIIVAQGSMSDCLVLLGDGLARVTHVKGDKEDTVCFGSGGDVFASFHSLWAREPAIYGLEALVDMTCHVVPIQKFRRLEEKYPELTKWLCLALVEQLYSFEVLYHKMTMATPEERLKGFWDFSNQKLRNMNPAMLSRVVPLKMIAQYLGMTPQTLSKVRRKLVGLV